MSHVCKEDSMLVKRIAACIVKLATRIRMFSLFFVILSISNKHQIFSVLWQALNPQPFTSYSEILVGNCNFFLHPVHLTPPLGCSHWNSGEKFGPQKTRIMGQWRQFVDRLSHFDTIPSCDRQTDGRTDVQSVAITYASVFWRTLTRTQLSQTDRASAA